MLAPSASVHPGSGRDGLRDRYASREALPRRSHHRDLRRHQRDSEAGHRWPAAEGVPGVDLTGDVAMVRTLNHRTEIYKRTFFGGGDFSGSR